MSVKARVRYRTQQAKQLSHRQYCFGPDSGGLLTLPPQTIVVARAFRACDTEVCPKFKLHCFNLPGRNVSDQT